MSVNSGEGHFYSQGGGEVRLPTTALAQKEDIPTTGDVVSCGQFPDEPPVKLRGLFEGECFQCFDQGEPCFLRRTYRPIPLWRPDNERGTPPAAS